MREDLKFFDRELSWLSFNYRVLQEAKDKTVPLFERIKFLAIYSSNLDEFFRVRVASLRSLLSLKKKTKKKLQLDPEKLLEMIKSTVHGQQEEFGYIFREDIIPELNKNNIFLVNDENYPEEHKDFLKNYFYDQVVPFVHPSLLDKNKIATFLHNSALYFSLRLIEKKENGEIPVKPNYKYAIAEIPADRVNRFLTLPKIGDKNYVIFLDDIIRIFLHELFPGYIIESTFAIKLTRDAELYIEDEFQGDLLEKIKKGLSRRKTGAPCRFLYDKTMPKSFLNFLSETLELDEDDLVPGGRYHNFNDFFSFPNFGIKKLRYESKPPLPCKDFDNRQSILEVINTKDVLLSFPYQSYHYVVRFIEEASLDDKVEAIYITLYRVASESRVVNALIKAAQNNKKVTVFVEVKARFDEESNFESAEELQNAGAKVLFSFPGLKVHSKICLVERKEGNNKKYYSYLATGNFNEQTANLYCDHALLTSYQPFGNELKKVFTFLETKNDPDDFDELLVAPFNMRKQFNKLIDNEISAIKEGKKGKITVKFNSLEDKKIIKKLYEASQAGVKIEVIVRGICCMIPGIENQSKNIKARSIVDRYLEHARIYIFYNGGDQKYFVASADWMKRNLSRRIEVGFPVYDENIRKQIDKMIDIQLKDNLKARRINKTQSNPYVKSRSKEKIRAQYDIYDYIKSLN